MTRFMNRVRFGVTSLEDRVTPAPAITAVAAGGVLTITGIVSPVAIDNNRFVLLNGAGAGGVHVAGSGGTTVNGGALPLDFTGIKSIVCRMNVGDDQITMTGLNLPGSVTINGGGGNNGVFLAGGATLGTLTITNGDGADNFGIAPDGNLYTIAGALTINNGTGGSTTGLGSGADNVIIGSVSVTNHALNYLSADGAALSVNGPLTETTIGGAGIAILAPQILLLRGATTITSGNGNGGVQLGAANPGSAVATKSITLRTGNGSSALMVEGASAMINGNVAVTTGAGTHTFDLDSANVDFFQLTGNLSINNGNGPTGLHLAAKTQVVVNGNVAVVNGAGDDEAVFGLSDKSVSLGSLALRNGDGNTVTKFVGNLTIYRTLNITNGAGTDEIDTSPFSSQHIQIAGATTINNGNGDTNLQFSGGGGTQMAGVSITNGDGTHTLTFGTTGAAVNLFALTIRNGNGNSTTNFLSGTKIVGNLTVTDLNGFDDFEVGGLDFLVTGTTTFNVGAGGSTTVFGASNSVTLRGAATFRAGAGDDNVSLSPEPSLGTTTVTTKALTFALGDGSNFAEIHGAVLVDGNVTFTGGAGNDILMFDGSSPGQRDVMTITGGVNFVGGDGNDQLLFGTDAVDHFSVNGALTANMGSGGNSVTLARCEVSGPVTVIGGEGQDSVSIAAAIFHKAMTIDLGAGSDGVAIEEVSPGTTTEFRGALTIRLGGGSDTLLLDTGDDDTVSFLGAVNVDGGAELDTIQIGTGSTLHFGGTRLVTSVETNPL